MKRAVAPIPPPMPVLAACGGGGGGGAGGGGGGGEAHTTAAWDDRLVELPAAFDAVGGGAVLSEAGSVVKGGGSVNSWSTLGRLMESVTLVWRFRVDSQLDFGLISGSEPVTVSSACSARAYSIWSNSNGWVRVLGKTDFRQDMARWNQSAMDVGSEVECTLDANARTMTFSVNGSPPYAALKDIKAPVRPAIWGGGAKLLRVRYRTSADVCMCVSDKGLTFRCTRRHGTGFVSSASGTTCAIVFGGR